VSVPQLLADYGYLAVFAGCLLEGEAILLLAGFAAHQGYLSAPLVVLTAFVGGTLGDQMFYFIGRHWGTWVLVRLPWVQRQAPRINGLLLRHSAALIIGVRFMYGLRIAGPILIGTSTVRPRRFLGFNMLGAAIWAPLVTGVGYLFGGSLQAVMPDFERYEGWGVLALIGIVVLIALAHRWFTARHRPPAGAAPDI
jgi:membrane protein DedA with SNARE-associated domain